MIINTERPYTCSACNQPLKALLMQHFLRRTLILGACDTPTCPNCHSHQAAEVVNADERTLATLEAIAAAHSVAIGNMPYMLAGV